MILSSHKIFKEDIVTEGYLKNLYLDNPDYRQNIRLGFSNRGVPEKIRLFQTGEHPELGEAIKIPRNWPINPGGIKNDDLVDKRTEGKKVKFNSVIKPRKEQVKPIKVLAKTEDGIYSAPCGSGKTVVALDALSKVGRTTLILVNKGDLLNQWQDRIKEFLGEDAGTVRQNTWEYKDRKIAVATLQTLFARKDELPEDFLGWPGLIISDEVHRISAPTFSRVIQMFPGKRRWGLTATPVREDGLEVVFHAHLGDIVYKIEEQELQPKIIMVTTDCYIPSNEYFLRGKAHMAKMVTAISEDIERNQIILNLLLKAAENKRKILILSGRVKHTKVLERSFRLNKQVQKLGVKTSIFIGKLSRKQREEAKNADVIFGTFAMAKEGLDLPKMDTLFLTTPFGSGVTAKQSVGRILRKYPGKKTPMVVDFVDRGIGMAKGLANKRYYLYDDLNYAIQII